MRFVGSRKARYKLFSIGNSDGNGGGGIFIVEMWVHKIVCVNSCISDKIFDR